jgi:hypothetical protein
MNAKISQKLSYIKLKINLIVTALPTTIMKTTNVAQFTSAGHVEWAIQPMMTHRPRRQLFWTDFEEKNYTRARREMNSYKSNIYIPGKWFFSGITLFQHLLDYLAIIFWIILFLRNVAYTNQYNTIIWCTLLIFCLWILTTDTDLQYKIFV